MATYISDSPAETEALGQKLAVDLRPGSILALQGELGTGKTQFVKGLVAGLGSAAEVTSPTFTILHEYGEHSFPIYHFDFFRIEDRDRLVQLGLDDYLFGPGVCVIEWADRFPDLMPTNARWIRFEMKSSSQRLISTE